MGALGVLVSVVLAADEKKAPSVTGKVIYDGKAAAPKKLEIKGDVYCEKSHDRTPIVDEKVVVGKDGVMANVFVYVKSGLEDKKWEVPEEPVVLDQKGCRYEPRVFGIMKDQKLEVRNSDATNHNVHGLPKKNDEFNKSQAKRGMKDTFEFDKIEDFMIKCDVHAWMRSWCHVMEHPFFATTNEKGEFEIADLPPGDYELEFWHESGTTQTAKVTVEAGKPTDLGEVKFKIQTRRRN
jgi:plastocyanin